MQRSRQARKRNKISASEVEGDNWDNEIDNWHVSDDNSDVPGQRVPKVAASSSTQGDVRYI